MILVLGAMLGLISVAFGAYAEHGLKESLTVANIQSLDTAIRYHQLYSLLISVIGLTMLTAKGTSRSLQGLALIGLLFIIGVVLFSGSIYLSLLTQTPTWVKVAPYGGMTLLFAWFSLALWGGWVGWRGRR